jgi:hypothetical protein
MWLYKLFEKIKKVVKGLIQYDPKGDPMGF